MGTLKNNAAANLSINLVAEICLYGTHDARVGFGYILTTTKGKMIGNGNPRPGCTATEALWAALGGLEIIGVSRTGFVRIFDSGGERCADIDLSEPSPIYGAIKWTKAPTFELKVADLIARGRTPEQDAIDENDRLTTIVVPGGHPGL